MLDCEEDLEENEEKKHGWKMIFSGKRGDHHMRRSSDVPLMERRKSMNTFADLDAAINAKR